MQALALLLRLLVAIDKSQPCKWRIRDVVAREGVK
jgi:hypothetical protein